MTSIIRVIDLETTGFAPPQNAPCEVAYVPLLAEKHDLAGEPTDWRVWQGESWLCDPGHPIPPETSAIHHITDADVRGAQPWRLALAEAAEKVSGLVAFAAHNARFESQWIGEDLTAGSPWICTWKCALRLWPEAPGHSNQTLRYWRNPGGLLRAEADRSHRAYPDAYVTAHLLRDMLEETTVEQLIAWTNEPALLTRIPFGELTGQPWAEADDGLLYWMLRKTFRTPDFTENVHFTARAELEKRGQNLPEDADYGDAA